MKKTFISAFLLLTLVGCKEENKIKNESQLIDEQIGQELSIEAQKFDAYLTENYVKPYNVEVKYRFDKKESNHNYVLVPAQYERSIEMAKLIKYLCLEPYDRIAPKNFLRDHFPKMLMFVGSGALNNNGTMVLGTAESGKKVVLYRLNSLDLKKTSIDLLNELYFSTIYHEFSHILHQKIEIPTVYKELSASDYVDDSWNTHWEELNKKSIEAGFISDYSSKNAHEDFVEIIAHYITLSEEAWEKKLKEAAGADGKAKGRAILEEKTTLVKNYLLNIWKLDIEKLRIEVQSRYAKLKDPNFIDELSKLD